MNPEANQEEIIAGTPTYARDGEGTLVTLPYRNRSKSGVVTLLGTVNFRFNLDLPPLPFCGDAAVPLGLMTAMPAGLPLRMEAPVSPVLIEGSARFQEIHQTIFPGEQIVPIIATAAQMDQKLPASGVGCFLSNGIDSWHSILRHREEVTHYIFILGFDIWLKHHDYAARSLALARASAAKLGKPLIVVETNAFDFAHHFIPWPRGSFPMQSAIVLLLSPVLGRVIQALDDHFAWFSDETEIPMLAEALGNETSRIQFTCGQFTRQQKMHFLCRNAEWLSLLRVCWDMPAGKINCGKCEKCLRTMIGLAIEGAGQLCPLLPPLDPAVLACHIYTAKSAKFYEDMIVAAENSPHANPEFLAVFRAMVHRNRLEILARELIPFRENLLTSASYLSNQKRLRGPLFSMLRRDDIWLLKKLRRHAATFREDIQKLMRKKHKRLLHQALWRGRFRKFIGLFRHRSEPEAGGKI